MLVLLIVVQVMVIVVLVIVLLMILLRTLLILIINQPSNNTSLTCTSNTFFKPLSLCLPTTPSGNSNTRPLSAFTLPRKVLLTLKRIDSTRLKTRTPNSHIEYIMISCFNRFTSPPMIVSGLNTTKTPCSRVTHILMLKMINNIVWTRPTATLTIVIGLRHCCNRFVVLVWWDIVLMWFIVNVVVVNAIYLFYHTNYIFWVTCVWYSVWVYI